MLAEGPASDYAVYVQIVWLHYGGAESIKNKELGCIVFE